MRVVQVTRFGGPEVLRVVDLPSPSLSPDAVRIRVAAAGVNFADIQMRMGLYPEAPPVPFVPGYEVAGTVTEAGPAVSTLKTGDRVLSLCRFGGYASEIVLPAAFVRKIPAGLTDVEAAAVPVAFITAWILLMDMARVRPGDRVLVPGAAGGVGTAVVQMAREADAEVVGLVGSSSKKELVLSLGAREVFTYGEWSSAPRPASFDIILEPRGGADAKRSLGFLAPAGRMVCYGVSSLVTGLRRSIPRAALSLLGMPIFTPIGLAMANRGVFGLNVLKYFDADVEEMRGVPRREEMRGVPRRGAGILQLGKAMEGAMDGFEKGRYRAVVGKTWSLAEAGEAHRHLQSREGTGKQVLLGNN